MFSESFILQCFAVYILLLACTPLQFLNFLKYSYSLFKIGFEVSRCKYLGIASKLFCKKVYRGSRVYIYLSSISILSSIDSILNSGLGFCTKKSLNFIKQFLVDFKYI